jgi:Protein of unknown function (DUF3667)
MTGSSDPSHEDQALVTTADPSLTLAAKKLAGSARCLNCSTELKGPFCYYCGQPDRNFMRFFPALLRDLMEDLLDLDSRFVRTLKPLLFKPGRLTRDYLHGRRFRYTPPMRLYIFSSIAFFLLAALLSSNAIIDQTTAGESGGKPLFDTKDISFNDEPWDRETNPVDIPWLPDWLNDLTNDEIEESPEKARQLNANPNLIVDKVFDILPATMFVLLPVVALIFKFWYLFAKRYFVEHLIFSLHNHAFLFTGLILLLLANATGDLLNAYDYSAIASGIGWLQTAVWIWIPVYLLISLRVVYAQNWFLTVGKFFVIGTSYVVLLSVVTAGVAIASFVLL